MSRIPRGMTHVAILRGRCSLRLLFTTAQLLLSDRSAIAQPQPLGVTYLTGNRLLRRIILTALLLLLIASASLAVTAAEMVKEQNFTIDPVALDLMESLGELTHLDAAFLTRISVLPAKKQKDLAVRFVMDGHITVKKLKKVPIPIVLPEKPEDILVLIYERIREDYWRGWYRRHTWSVRMKLKEWHETAYRRFVDPEEGQKLIEIFFQSLDGTYKGSNILY